MRVPAETLMVPLFCTLPVYQVRLAALTFHTAPALRMMVSSEYRPSQALVAAVPLAERVMPASMVRLVLAALR